MCDWSEQKKEEIGKRLRQLRKEHKMTISDLLECLYERNNCIDEKSVRRYERGEFCPKLESLICFADIYHTSLDYIVFGKNMSDDDSCTYYDNFKRLNRLIYSLSVHFVEDRETGRCYLELWDDASKVYWARLTDYGASENYKFEHWGKNPFFTVEELDALIMDFKEDKRQLRPTLERATEMLRKTGQDPQVILGEKIEKVKQRKDQSTKK